MNRNCSSTIHLSPFLIERSKTYIFIMLSKTCPLGFTKHETLIDSRWHDLISALLCYKDLVLTTLITMMLVLCLINSGKTRRICHPYPLGEHIVLSTPFLANSDCNKQTTTRFAHSPFCPFGPNLGTPKHLGVANFRSAPMPGFYRI